MTFNFYLGMCRRSRTSALACRVRKQSQLLQSPPHLIVDVLSTNIPFQITANETYVISVSPSLSAANISSNCGEVVFSADRKTATYTVDPNLTANKCTFVSDNGTSVLQLAIATSYYFVPLSQGLCGSWRTLQSLVHRQSLLSRI